MRQHTLMVRLIAGIALGLLVVAGVQLHRNSRPEAQGKPSGGVTAGSAPSRSATSRSTTTGAAEVVVGLGDSVTAGSACDCTDFITAYAGGLPHPGRASAVPVNLGRGGLTSDGLLSQLSTDAQTRQAVARAGTVVVTIGANDLVPLVEVWRKGGCQAACYEPAAVKTGRTVQRVGQLVHALNATARVIVTTYWNVYEDGDVAEALRGASFLRWSDAVTRAANDQICAAARRASALCVDLYAPFKGELGQENPTPLLADDGDHPNAAGHQFIARALLQATVRAGR